MPKASQQDLDAHTIILSNTATPGASWGHCLSSSLHPSPYSLCLIFLTQKLKFKWGFRERNTQLFKEKKEKHKKMGIAVGWNSSTLFGCLKFWFTLRRNGEC